MTATNLWLDDIRPAPADFQLWAKTASEALSMLEGQSKAHPIQIASLDHDLGWCDTCSAAARFDEDGVILNPLLLQCSHVWNGVDMVNAMIELGAWPTEEIRVHSANPDGAARMMALLEAEAPAHLKIVRVHLDR